MRLLRFPVDVGAAAALGRSPYFFTPYVVYHAKRCTTKVRDMVKHAPSSDNADHIERDETASA